MTAQDALDTAIIDRITDAFNRRDLDGMAAEFTEDVVFHSIPGVQGPPPILEGREVVMEQIKAMMQLDEPFFEHHNAEALAGYVVGLSTVTFKVGDEKRSVQIIDVCRLRDGKLAERWTMADRPDEITRTFADLAGQAGNA